MSTYTEQELQVLEVGRLVKAGLTQPLGQMPQGSVGRILAVSGMGDHDVACVEVLHYGLLGRDPLAVRINQSMTVALRQVEANIVLVGPLLDPTDPGTRSSQEYGT